MPADIRSFFGGKGSQPNGRAAPPPKKPAEPATRGKTSRKSRVIEDSDDDIIPPRKATPIKTNKPKYEAPKAVETTASDYFATNNRPKRSEAMKPKSARHSAATKSKFTPSPAKPSATHRTTPARKAKKQYRDDDLEDMDNDDNIFAAEFKTNPRHDDYIEESESDDFEPIRKPRSSLSAIKKGKVEDDDFEEDLMDIDEDLEVEKKSSKKVTPRASRKRKTPETDSEDDFPSKKAKGKRGKAPGAKAQTPKKPKKPKTPEPESATMQAIYESVPTVKPPPPPEKGEDGKFKFDFRKAKAEPANAGSKEIPDGAVNCLAGLSFVFTGTLDTLGREDGHALVKRYGGKVVGAPSSKTSYVVLGGDAGPSKLEKIRKHNLKTIDEDGLFFLIRTLPAHGGDGKANAEYQKKAAEDEKRIKQAAAEIEKQEKLEREQAKKRAAAASSSKTPASSQMNETPASSKLWTVKYAPSQITQICGNKGQVEKLQMWLRNFPKYLKQNFKSPGKDGSGLYRAVMIHGPPGIGKTTAAHLVAKLEGFDVVESNASDTRSKKLVEEGLRGVLSTRSLMGYFAGDGKRVDPSKKKLVLIMDEVDGMSAGDRGGVGALAAVCKKTHIPMILICNDRRLPKMKPFDHCTYDLAFRRPTTDQIRSRIMTIAYREGLKIPAPAIDALIEGTGKDIRQVVNMVSTAKLDEANMDFDSSKEMAKRWEKQVVLKPWDITSKILSGYMFSDVNKHTLNDKIELYFNDHEFSYLMLQENYLNTNPRLSNDAKSEKEKALKILELVDQAAESISDGDLVDRLIHGSQQQWSLMPTHGVFSFVRPASFVAGSMAGNSIRFTSWLGKNSNQMKLAREVREIQGHMRLRTSADRHAIRQQYVPMLWTKLVKRLADEGKDSAQSVIDLMDTYFLTKDDFDSIAELGLGPMESAKHAKIPSQAKATFTRLYNAAAHPMPFVKASEVFAPRQKTKEKPDLEDVLEDSEAEGPAADEAPELGEEEDLAKDKYIKQPKKKRGGAAAGATRGKGKGKVADDDEVDEDDEDVKPKRGAASRGRGRGRGGKK